MKVFGLMLVKDEADIIQHCISDALRWADALYILDNGSTDGSWEILQRLRSDRVVPWKQDHSPYRRSMRAEIFNEFRSNAQDGDWWFIADADEFYPDNTREFLATVPHHYRVVCKKSIDYFITEEDIEEYEFTGDFTRDRDHIRYIEPNCWTECRFFRHRTRLRWDPSKKEQKQMPDHAGLFYPSLIPVRHYQYRSPKQMQHRLDIRTQIPRDKIGQPFKHIKQTDWHELLRPRASLVLDPGPQGYSALGTRRTIKEKPLDRIVKLVLHGTGIYP